MVGSERRCKSRTLWLIWFLAINLSIGTAFAKDEHAASIAVKSILRLSPSAFSQLPDAVVDELAKRKCKVPQVGVPGDNPSKSYNVISGQFKKPGQSDWAVLCSADEHSRILIFLNGRADEVESIGGISADRDSLQGWGQDEQGQEQFMFSQIIPSVDREYILERYERYGGMKPPLIDHEGISVGLSGKYSIVYYWYKGKWLILQGAD